MEGAGNLNVFRGILVGHQGFQVNQGALFGCHVRLPIHSCITFWFSVMTGLKMHEHNGEQDVYVNVHPQVCFHDLISQFPYFIVKKLT